MDKLIISGRLVLHLKEDRPYRIHIREEKAQDPALGDIYRARVQNVNTGLRNAFLELGEGLKAYMNLTEEGPGIKAGEEITVLISQEGIGEKLSTATPELTLPGEWLVLTAEPGFLGFSRRAGFDGPQREAIHEVLSPWFEDCGFIIRTAAEQAPLESLREEAALLAAEYKSLTQRAQHSPAPLRLLRGQPLWREWLQGLDKKNSLVITDDKALWEELKEYYTARGLSLDGLRFYEEASPSLSALYNLEKALREAKDKKVWLRSGAYLVIEHTEAMTVIDVNSGKNESTARGAAERINREAAAEVCRQLILRNLSGMILVDFINMSRPGAGEELLTYLKELVREDPVFTQVVDMTPLGLVEITRRRIRRPL